ncbi:small nuclear ribonucleoprotein hPrp3 [Mycena vitilis]|nr:small nuclear ribonucleoprotein hPrp3 [Mycena vitilis]
MTSGVPEAQKDRERKEATLARLKILIVGGKLTDEQRREKAEAKKAGEDKQEIQGAVFKIKNFTDPTHSFKVRKHAEQSNLTGVCIFNPHFGLVYVEGAAKLIKKYKRLMMYRIAWTETARRCGAEDVLLEDPNCDVEEGNAEAARGRNPDGAATSLEHNKCYLVWEGTLQDRSFSEFNARSCPTDEAAKELLGETLEGYWDLAKNWKAEEEELL